MRRPERVEQHCQQNQHKAARIERDLAKRCDTHARRDPDHHAYSSQPHGAKPTQAKELALKAAPWCGRGCGLYAIAIPYAQDAAVLRYVQDHAQLRVHRHKRVAVELDACGVTSDSEG
jgi:hypothetical protein